MFMIDQEPNGSGKGAGRRHKGWREYAAESDKYSPTPVGAKDAAPPNEAPSPDEEYEPTVGPERYNGHAKQDSSPTRVSKSEGVGRGNRVVESGRSIEEEIGSIAPDTSRIELAKRLDPVLMKLAAMPKTQSEAYLGAIRLRFSLKEKEIDSYRHTVRDHRRELVRQSNRDSGEDIKPV